MSDEFEYVRNAYDVPAKKGMRVEMNGKPGVITSAQEQYVMVKFDGLNHSKPCHPTWEMKYLEAEHQS